MDIALIDSFAQTRDVNEVLAEANAERYVFYSWSLEPDLIETWARFGVVGFLDKRLTANELADALERIHHGESGVASADYPPSPDFDLGDWPGRDYGLSAREAEVIALITQGLGTGRSQPDVHERQHGQDLHPHGVPEDRRRHPDAGGSLGHRPRIPPGQHRSQGTRHGAASSVRGTLIGRPSGIAA